VLVLVQGEKFRPDAIEKTIDEMILNFIDTLKILTSESLELIKKKTVEELNDFSPQLSEVADKYQASVEEYDY
jgi:hypothetical protein